MILAQIGLWLVTMQTCKYVYIWGGVHCVHGERQPGGVDEVQQALQARRRRHVQVDHARLGFPGVTLEQSPEVVAGTREERPVCRELAALRLQRHVAQEALGAQRLVAGEQRAAMSFAVRQEVTHDAQGGKRPGRGWGQPGAAGGIAKSFNCKDTKMGREVG